MGNDSMKGISISLYDKFDDLGILVDIVRNNWEDKYYISVCSNHPDAKNHIEDLDVEIDEFHQGAQIQYAPGKMRGLEAQVNKISRVYNTIKTAFENAASVDEVDYVMHLHADAWPLAEDQLQRLIKEMESRNQPVAFKGRGLGHRWPFPIGHIMDQYFIIDANYAQTIDFFGHSPFELLPDRGIHTAMLVILLGKVGWSNVYHYSDQTEQEYWDGRSTMSPRPMMFHPEYEYVHIATEDFPNNLGKSLQARYLEEWGHTEGTEISHLLETHLIPEEELFTKLDNLERKLNSNLSTLGVSVSDLGRDFQLADDICNRSLLGKTKFAIGYHAGPVTEYISGIKQQIKQYLDIHQSLPAADPVAEAWPEQNLEDVYAQELNPDHFPDKHRRNMWFNEKEDL